MPQGRKLNCSWTVIKRVNCIFDKHHYMIHFHEVNQWIASLSLGFKCDIFPDVSDKHRSKFSTLIVFKFTSWTSMYYYVAILGAWPDHWFSTALYSMLDVQILLVHKINLHLQGFHKTNWQIYVWMYVFDSWSLNFKTQ